MGRGLNKKIYNTSVCLISKRRAMTLFNWRISCFLSFLMQRAFIFSSIPILYACRHDSGWLHCALEVKTGFGSATPPIITVVRGSHFLDLSTITIDRSDINGTVKCYSHAKVIVNPSPLQRAHINSGSLS